MNLDGLEDYYRILYHNLIRTNDELFTDMRYLHLSKIPVLIGGSEGVRSFGLASALETLYSTREELFNILSEEEQHSLADYFNHFDIRTIINFFYNEEIQLVEKPMLDLSFDDKLENPQLDRTLQEIYNSELPILDKKDLVRVSTELEVYMGRITSIKVSRVPSQVPFLSQYIMRLDVISSSISSTYVWCDWKIPDYKGYTYQNGKFSKNRVEVPHRVIVSPFSVAKVILYDTKQEVIEINPITVNSNGQEVMIQKWTASLIGVDEINLYKQELESRLMKPVPGMERWELELLRSFIQSYIDYVQTMQQYVARDLPSSIGLVYDKLCAGLLINQPQFYRQMLYNKYENNRLNQNLALLQSPFFKFLDPGTSTALILGAGPIGLLFALALKQQFKEELNVILVETRQKSPLRKSSYSRYQKFIFRNTSFFAGISTYLQPLFETDNDEYTLEIRVLEAILYYVCLSHGVIVHLEKPDYDIMEVVQTFRPSLIINCSGSDNLSRGTDTTFSFEPTNWLADPLLQQNLILRTDSQGNSYTVRYEGERNKYTLCDVEGNPLETYHMYMIVPDGLNLREKIFPLISKKGNKDVVLRFRSRRAYINLKSIFDSSNVNMINTEMPHQYERVLEIVRQICRESLVKDTVVSEVERLLRNQPIIFLAPFAVVVDFATNPVKMIEYQIVNGTDNTSVAECSPIELDDISVDEGHAEEKLGGSRLSDITLTDIPSTETALYLLCGDACIRDYYATGEGVNKWLSVIESFVLRLVEKNLEEDM